jgi:ketosteroid isomerase-like protein
MGKIFTALALAALAAGPAGASDKADVMAVLHQWVDGYNKGGDMKSALATCADQAAIVDSIPPYEWNGAGACAKWLNDYDAFNKTSEVTDASASLGKVRHVEITGDRAYAIFPLTLTYKVKGKPMKETGAIWTVALHKEASGWRITGWSYTAGAEAEVKAAAGG